jgi:ADP-ribose pyrophosphatase
MSAAINTASMHFLIIFFVPQNSAGLSGNSTFGSPERMALLAAGPVLGIQSPKFNRVDETTVTADTRIHFSGRYLGIRERDNWEYATRTNAHAVAVLVPVTDHDELILVEQYRIPVEAMVIELPAGLVGDLDDPEESILTAAQRELIEETGFRAGQLTHLLTCPSSPGMCDEMISFFMADQLERVGPGGGDENERIEVHIVPLATASEWISEKMKNGRLVDPKTYSALFWLQRRQAGLDLLPG